MRTRSSLYTAFIGLAFLLACSLSIYAQCNLSQGCKPADNLTGQPNGTGQVFVGDGASNNGAGGWTTAYAGSNQCLSCHNDGTITTYLMSGHKNTLRKLAPGVLWAGPDGASYSSTDAHYGSGSTYDWNNNLVTIGWCDPLSVPGLNGLPANDPTCSYPYYSQSNPSSPAPYSPVAPTTSAGGVQNLFYLFGGWEKYGGAANPTATHLGTIFSNGFTGGLYPNGTFGCARCHATGYNFDASGPEPTQNTNNVIAPIPDAQFSRIPSDGFIAPGTKGTSSWFLTGVQCERCHQGAWNYGAHGSGPWQATMPQNEAATALCLECHRGENITMANAHTVPPTQGSITPQATPKVIDHGYCSDQSGSAYAACVANTGNSWVYKPSFQHEASTFLNSPHARFTGNLTQNAQHSPDLSVTLTGSYQSLFSSNPQDPSKNNGCTGCHDPHQSVSPSSKIPEPYVCNDCHNLSNTVPQTVNHPTGPGTPFPTGTSADVPGACVTCHMVAADGQVKSHLFRINDDGGYSTFPTPDQLHNQNITSPNIGSDGVINNAAFNDIDLACGQCHIGGNGIVNPYGLTPPPASANAPHLTKSYLRAWLAGAVGESTGDIHNSDSPAPLPTFTPGSGGVYNTPQMVTISESAPYMTIYYNTDGTTPLNGTSIEYSPGTTIPVNANTTLKAIAVGVGGWAKSLVPSATYTFRTAVPSISPAGAIYTTPISVSLTDITPNVTYYYTLDGSMPTTNSTLYTGPVTISASATFSAIAVSSYGTSAARSVSYTINLPPASTPKFSPSPSVSYTGPQSVTISDTTPNVKIYYTVDGSTPTTSSTQYTGAAIPVTATGTTVKAIAAAYGYSNSQVGAATYTLVAAMPTFSVPGSTFTSPQSVTLNDVTPGVTIYYTLDGSTPTTSSKVYTGTAITVSTTTTISAIAAGGGYGAGGMASATYRIVAANPTFSPVPGGTFTGSPMVTLSDTSPGTSIYYTLDGSTPTTSSTLYTSAIPVSTTTTINAIAAGNGYAASTMSSATYRFAAIPTFSVPGGMYTTSQSVKLSDTTPYASIYYTLDGSTPTTSSKVYTGTAITISTTTTINAIAAGGGYYASGAGSTTYTISGGTGAMVTGQPQTISITNSGTDTGSSGNGYATSTVASGTYNLVASTPVLSPAAKGIFSAPISVALKDATPGVAIYYTTDGSTPTAGSAQYAGPIPISSTTTIKAIAAGKDVGASAVVTGTYSFVAAAPVFSPAPGGTFRAPLSVTLTDATQGVTIYYTTNGSTPTTSSTPYTKPIRITGSTTIKAIAVGNGYGASPIAGASYAQPSRPAKPRKVWRSGVPKLAVVTEPPRTK